ncbi:putative IQ domain-containing protein H [Monocercomonoides exilis]|uniref:putative IQ domain-containing protein H n=1 Tax=Monocercomonoides exilis TaxID=2049356 RepID=UPI00355A3687|nr:putative IQ domain-containing protein H [Monocercomonoides exilis]|eukprot:MONOS_15208.1-p1 / transcript=MONOS_15208.1 / gene=MONOS_15208 / organism=Monocercomonoides_exilis_PA203 / gene_product=IQ domain-containing protein H / transcript_product=IQ domain-containing protein H / location=Mono_scaffold01170:4511-5200(+) / protein_length=229 / sequence_SO=supercontig / SO=protein_coding / is_pseudo=false
MDDIERRLRIVVPEAAGVYGRYMPLSLQLLMSPRALQTLRGYVVARRAVLYGGVARAYDVALSSMLSVPLVAPLPSLAASVGTKSGSKRIFAAADVNAFPSIYDLFDPSLLPSAIARLVSRSPQSRRVVVKLDDEVMGRGVAVCEVGGIVEKEQSEEGLRMEDVVLSLAAIVLAVLEEREEAEEGEGYEEKDKYPTAHREYVRKIKENQGKLEEAMVPLVTEALELARL